MTGRHHRNRLLGAIDIAKLQCDLTNTRQAFIDDFRTEVIKFQQDVVFIGSGTTALLDFRCHGTRHHITRCEILHGRCVTLHESFAVLVQQYSSLTPHALSDEHTRAGHTSRMELPEFHIFKRNPRACRHTQAVTSIDEGIGARCINASRTASGKQRCLGVKNHHLAGFHFQRGYAKHVALDVTNQVQRHPLDKELCVCKHIALVQRMQHGVTGAVGRTAGTLDGLLAEIGRMPTERTLINRAIVIAIKWHAEMFKLDHRLGRGATHKLNRVLVSKPIRAFDGVVHMPMPVVLTHVAERRTDPALCGDSMRAGRENLGQHRDFQTCIGQLQCRPQSGTTGTDNDGVIFANRNCHGSDAPDYCDRPD